MLIKCVKLNSRVFFLILFPIFKIIGKVIEKEIKLNNLFILPFLMSISNILCLFLWFSRIKLNQRKKKMDIENIGTLSNSLKESIIKENESESDNSSKVGKRGQSQFEILFDENKRKNKIKILKEILFIVILGIIFFIFLILRSIFYIYIFENKTNSIMPIFFSLVLKFVLMSILGRYILNDSNKFYKHKIISFILIILISIIYFFSSLDYKLDNLGKILIILFSSETIYSFFYIGGKKYNNFSYKSPFKMVFFVGLICFFLLIITQIIFTNHFDNNKLWNKFFQDLKKRNKNTEDKYYFNILFYLKDLGSKKFLFFPILFFLLINNYFEWQILSFFSASHFASSNFLYIIILPYIYNEHSIKNIFILFLIYILIVFLFLIFNEYIILYFFSLEENTIYEKKLKEIQDQENNQQMGRISTSSNDDIYSDENDNESNHWNNISNTNTLNELVFNFSG